MARLELLAKVLSLYGELAADSILDFEDGGVEIFLDEGEHVGG